MRNSFGIVLLISWIICSNTHASTPADTRADGRLLLKENWRIQPSTQVRADGKEISTTGFRTDNCYSATVPSTMLAALVDAQVFLDPYHGLNLRSLPGATNPIGSEDFMFRPMPPESPLRSSWWYRTEFGIPPEYHMSVALNSGNDATHVAVVEPQEATAA